MKLSKMVEETLTTEEIEVIEEKKCNKKKILTEEGMVNCGDCGTEYTSEKSECPQCGSTKTIKAVEEATECGKVNESTEVVVTESNDVLLEEPATADDTTELEWLKSLASN